MIIPDMTMATSRSGGRESRQLRSQEQSIALAASAQSGEHHWEGDGGFITTESISWETAIHMGSHI